MARRNGRAFATIHDALGGIEGGAGDIILCELRSLLFILFFFLALLAVFLSLPVVLLFHFNTVALLEISFFLITPLSNSMPDNNYTQRPMEPDTAEDTRTFAVEFARNTQSRCPCVLLLDTSGSMEGERINELNRGIRTLREQLMTDRLARKMVEVGIITFGPVKVESQFQTVESFTPPILEASGDTPIGAAIKKAIEMVEWRKEKYREGGVSYYRPWIFMITDGDPTDEWKLAAAEIRKGEKEARFLFFAVGVEGADMDILNQIASPDRPALKLKGMRFNELFDWLANSMTAISHSQRGDSVPLPSTNNWLSVNV